jgi:hypothetical protein
LLHVILVAWLAENGFLQVATMRHNRFMIKTT